MGASCKKKIEQPLGLPEGLYYKGFYCLAGFSLSASRLAWIETLLPYITAGCTFFTTNLINFSLLIEVSGVALAGWVFFGRIY
jgi:hypothetical protein